jgi:glycosyltransferase involved in cell wall biosynthesis
MARFLRLLARPGVAGVGVSLSVAEDAAGALRGRVPVAAEYNAVDLSRFRPDGPALDLDAASGLPPAPPGTVRLGLVGTFARWKGHDVFLDAAAKAGERAPADRPCRFYIVGGPIYKTAGSQWSVDELKARASGMGLGQSIGFVGHQNDPSLAMRGLDVIVHASTRPEPFGRVIVEGMACGKAVIAVAGGGSAELFDHERTALGVPPDDPEALASAMLRLASDPGLRGRLGRDGASSASSRFDRAGLGERWAARYERSSGQWPVAGGQ